MFIVNAKTDKCLRIEDKGTGGTSTSSNETGGTEPTRIVTSGGFLLYNQSTSFGIAIVNSTATSADLIIKNLANDPAKKLLIQTAKAQLELDGGTGKPMLFSSQITTSGN